MPTGKETPGEEIVGKKTLGEETLRDKALGEESLTEELRKHRVKVLNRRGNLGRGNH